jgi:hypothetical protein
MDPRTPRRARCLRYSRDLRSRRALGLFATALAATLSSPLFADDPVEPITLSFEGSAGCPDAASFDAQVRARTARFRPISAGETGRAFHARVATGDGQFVGKLVIEEPGVSPAERTLSGATCADVVAALALVTALAIDPQAKTSAIAVTEVPVEPPPPAPTEAPSAAPSAPPAPPPSASAPRPSAPSLRPAPEPERPLLWLELGSSLALGVTPAPLLTPSLTVEGRFDERSWLAPRLRFGLLRGQDGPDAQGSGFTTFTWTAALLEACGLALRSGPLRLSPCVATELGVLRGEGDSFAPARASGRTWFAIDLGARLSLELGDAVSVGLGAELALPFTKDTFVVEPARTVHAVPDVGARFGFGAAIGFE